MKTFEEFLIRRAPILEARLADLVGGSELKRSYDRAVAGGKRVRPALALLAAELLEAKSSVALDLACSIELTHCASLVFDDIIDGHSDRRGSPSLHKSEGLRLAITTGFTLPSIAMNVAALHSPRAAQLLADAWVSMCMGILKEEDSYGVPLETRYLTIVDLKTARLFSAAAAFGAISAGNGSAEPSLVRYGIHLGRVFQMADDIADIEAGQPLPPSLEAERMQVLKAATLLLPRGCHSARMAAGELPASRLRDLLVSAPEEIVRMKGVEVP